MHAELDTNRYPTGVQVTDAELAALPILRHRFHGDWNYTLHPRPPWEETKDSGTTDEPPVHNPPPLTVRCLRHPELTGMPDQQLCELIDTLIPELELQREQTLRARRGRERLVAPGTGPKAKLTPADRILATVLHLRKLASMSLFGRLFGVTAVTISRASQEVRPLLEARGHHIGASTARFRTPADIAVFLTPDPTQTKIKEAS